MNINVENIVDLTATYNELKMLLANNCENNGDKMMVHNAIDSLEDLLIHIGAINYPDEVRGGK